MYNILILWIEDGEKKWEMVKKDDVNTFAMTLFHNKKVDLNTICYIPTNGFIQGLWLIPDKHKSNRVDFWNFHEDIGCNYINLQIKEEDEPILHEIKERNSDTTKYGWISPEGKYYQCGYQGHINLADKICFGLIDTDNSEKYLEEHGWCKIYKPLFEDRYSVYVGGRYTITDKQMKTLTELGLENAKDISKMLNKE